MARKRRRLPKQRKFAKEETFTPELRESGTSGFIWKPDIELPENIKQIPREQGSRIFHCTQCLAESDICISEEWVEMFITWHRKKSPKCF